MLAVYVARNSQIKVNLPKYAVHGSGASKPPALVHHVPLARNLGTNAISQSCIY